MAGLLSDELVIFGRSPFINAVDVPRIISRYTTVGFNHFGQSFKPNYLFLFDRWYDPGLAEHIFYPSYFPPPLITTPIQVWESYLPTRSDSPLFSFSKRHNCIELGFRYFSPSAAISFAHAKGFKKIYLVGVDHVESDVKFDHFDGINSESSLTVKAHKAFKQFCYKSKIPIFQTNPAVSKDWDIPFTDIESLYV